MFGLCAQNRRCSSRQHHYTVKDADLLATVGKLVAATIQEHLSGEVQTTGNVIDTKELDIQRKRLEDGYQAGVLSLESFSERIAELDALERKQADVDNQRREHAAQLKILKELSNEIEYIPRFLMEAPPQQVNKLLHQILEKIIVGESIQLVYR